MKFSGEAIRKTISIHAPVNLVWETLTDPKLAEQWLSDDPITMITDWIVGQRITIRGDLHGISFENKGIVLAFEPGQVYAPEFLVGAARSPGKLLPAGIQTKANRHTNHADAHDYQFSDGNHPAAPGLLLVATNTQPSR